MILAEPIQITQKIAQEFECMNILYYVGGSLASSLQATKAVSNFRFPRANAFFSQCRGYYHSQVVLVQARGRRIGPAME